MSVFRRINIWDLTLQQIHLHTSDTITYIKFTNLRVYHLFLLIQGSIMIVTTHTPKHILADLRNGNYAHPGEEQAIELTMKHIEKNSKHNLLDVGCGLGGTAHYLNKNGWGIPCGIDIDTKSIEFAQTTYPDLNFQEMNVEDVARNFTQNFFDVAYLFNSFYAFINQEYALKQIRKVCSDNSQLVLFDYMIYENFNEPFLPFAPNNNVYARTNFTPIKRDSIENTLQTCGWKIQKFIDIGDKYDQWYLELVNKCHKQKEALITKFNIDLYNWLESSYTALLTRIQQNKLSGCIIIANAIN